MYIHTTFVHFISRSVRFFYLFSLFVHIITRLIIFLSRAICCLFLCYYSFSTCTSRLLIRNVFFSVQYNEIHFTSFFLSFHSFFVLSSLSLACSLFVSIIYYPFSLNYCFSFFSVSLVLFHLS